MSCALSTWRNISIAVRRASGVSAATATSINETVIGVYMPQPARRSRLSRLPRDPRASRHTAVAGRRIDKNYQCLLFPLPTAKVQPRSDFAPSPRHSLAVFTCPSTYDRRPPLNRTRCAPADHASARTDGSRCQWRVAAALTNVFISLASMTASSGSTPATSSSCLPPSSTAIAFRCANAC